MFSRWLHAGLFKNAKEEIKDIWYAFKKDKSGRYKIIYASDVSSIRSKIHTLSPPSSKGEADQQSNVRMISGWVLPSRTWMLDEEKVISSLGISTTLTNGPDLSQPEVPGYVRGPQSAVHSNGTHYYRRGWILIVQTSFAAERKEIGLLARP